MGLINRIKKSLVRFTKTIKFSQSEINFFNRSGIGKKLTKYVGTQGEYAVELPGGNVIKLVSANTYSDNRLMRFGLFYNEKISKQLWMLLCESAQVVADVGANVGQFTLMALGTNPNLAVEAFEPLPVNIKTLKKNLAANRNLTQHVVVHEMALSNTKGTETLYFGEGDIYTPSLKQDGITNASINVPTDTMDNLISKKIDLVKMDIEGAETYVLQGMTRILANDQPFILIEVLKTETGKEIENILAPFHYQYFFIDEEKGLFSTAVIDRRQKESHNYLLVPTAKLSSVPSQLIKG